MLAELCKNPTSETLTTFWGSPVLVAVGGARHAAELAASAAQLASPTDSMVIVYTIAAGEPASDEAESTTRSSWVDPVLRATAMLDAYRMPYRVIIDDRPISSAEPDRTREVGWAIWDQARSCRSQCVVVGRHDGVEPGVQVHRHVAAAGKTPVVTVRLPGGVAGDSGPADSQGRFLGSWS
jgi:hypothetical protein